MPTSRSLIAVACAAGLLAVPATAAAQKGRSATSHVVKTPKGNQLVVPVTVRYKLDGKGKSLKRSALSTRVAVAARLPGGRVLRASETRRLPGKARVRVEHHPFFTVSQTRVLRRALAAKRKVKLAVASSLRADLDGDGKTDARTAQTSSQVLARPTAESSPAPLKHQQGNDPCSVLGLTSATCQNVTGSPFTATHFWDSGQVFITCGLAYPWATSSVSTQTSSKLYTQTATVAGNRDHAVRITIIDDNVRGHPYTYTPTVACTTTPNRADVDQRVSVITLGVDDVARSRAFYTALGWEPSLEPDGRVIFFQALGLVFALWAREDMEAETGVSGGRPGGLMLAYNVSSDPEVDDLLAAAADAGGTVVSPARRMEWGGWSGTFADPDGHLWEVAHNQHWTVAEDGSVSLAPPGTP